MNSPFPVGSNSTRHTRRRGRPPKLDAAKQEQVLGILRIGASMRIAANAVGCCPRTIMNTAKREPEFAKRINQAQSHHNVTLLQSIRTAATESKYWRAAAWLLERIDPDQFLKQPAQGISLNDLREFMEELSELIDEEVHDADTRTRIAERTDQHLRTLSHNVHGALEAAVDYVVEESEMLEVE